MYYLDIVTLLSKRHHCQNDYYKPNQYMNSLPHSSSVTTSETIEIGRLRVRETLAKDDQEVVDEGEGEGEEGGESE